MKDKILKIYLAGKMGGLSLEEMNLWREEMKFKLNLAAEFADYELIIINPVEYFNFEEQKYQSELEIEEFDLSHVVTSDVVIVNLDGLDTSDGSKLEIHDAKYHLRIPVIAFGDRELYEKLHSWVKNDITRIESDIDGVVTYIKDFYMR